MIEQIGTAIRFAAHFTAAKVGATGLADVTVDVWNPAGAQVVTDGAATEVGGGLYVYTYATPSTEGVHLALFKTADGTVDLQHVPAAWAVGVAGVESLDAAVSSRVEGTAAELIDAAWDEVLTGATHNVMSSAGRRLRQITDGGLYEGGFVHIDTINGVAGTTTFVNGTVLSPSSNLADATTLAVALGLRAFRIRNGSTLTLAQTYTRYDFVGEQWTLALGGQSVTECGFHGALVSGVGTGSLVLFERCHIGDATLPPGEYHEVGMRGTWILGTGDYFLNGCDQGSPANVSPTLSLATDSNVRLRHHSGGVTVLGLVSGQQFSMDGFGRLTLDATCTGGTVFISGTIRLINNSSGVTINDSSRFSRPELVDAVFDEALSGHIVAGSAGAALAAAGSAGDPLTSPVPGAYVSGTAGFALGRIGTGEITAVQPVSSDGTRLTLVRGDDYFEAEGRALAFSPEGASDWPDISGATEILMTVRRRPEALGSGLDTVLFTQTDKVASRTSTSVTFELASVKTTVLVPLEGRDTAKFDIQATISGRRVTLVTGLVRVVEDQSRS